MKFRAVALIHDGLSDEAVGWIIVNAFVPVELDRETRDLERWFDDVQVEHRLERERDAFGYGEDEVTLCDDKRSDEKMGDHHCHAAFEP